MSLDAMLQLVPAFVLVFFRVGGMVMAAPLFGTARVPRQVRLMFALVLAAGMLPSIPALPRLPQTTWQLTAGIAGELVFGLAIGTALNFVFVAVHWAGEIIGQQMGLGLGQVFDPQLGQSGSVVSDLYYLLTLVIFLVINGHHAFLRGVQASFTALPLMSAGIDRGVLDLVLGLLGAATNMALQLSAPMLLTMLLTDVVLGFISKTVPQVNVMTAGLSLRSVVGMLVLILGLALSSQVIANGFVESLKKLGGAMGD